MFRIVCCKSNKKNKNHDGIMNKKLIPVQNFGNVLETVCLMSLTCWLLICNEKESSLSNELSLKLNSVT